MDRKTKKMRRQRKKETTNTPHRFLIVQYLPESLGSVHVNSNKSWPIYMYRLSASSDVPRISPKVSDDSISLNFLSQFASAKNIKESLRLNNFEVLQNFKKLTVGRKKL